MSKSLWAAESRLKSILCDSYRFQIPVYQRPYSWTTEETAQLLDDLLEAFEEAAEGQDDEAPPYFLGSVVLIKEPDNPLSDIVDGQQRLTTLTILLAVLRDLASRDETENLHAFIWDRGNPYKGSTAHYRLNLRERDADFFRTHVQENGATVRPPERDDDLTDAQRRIIENRDLLREYLGRLSDGDRTLLAKFVLQSCSLVVVGAVDQEAAVRIFSILNNRGLNLSPTDILKAQIIRGWSETEQQRYTKVWEDMEDALGRTQFLKLFSYLRAMYLDHRKDQTLVRDVLSIIQMRYTSGQHFIDATLLPASAHLSHVLAATLPAPHGSDAVNRALRRLNRIENSDWVPPALVWFTEQAPEGTADFARALERLAYGLLLCRAPENERKKRYLEVVAAIDRGEALTPTSPLHLRTDEKRKAMRTLTGRIADELRPPAVRAILLALEEEVSGREIESRMERASLERVLPKDPPVGSLWLKWYPFKGQRERWTDALGNLFLVPQKRAPYSSRWEFDKKIRHYQAKPGVRDLVQFQQVAMSPTWEQGELERRHKHLIGFITRMWELGPVPGAQQAVEPGAGGSAIASLKRRAVAGSGG
ncbi:MAG: DUF262 domain-containing protein [Hyphomicrobiaceae bacterium]